MAVNLIPSHAAALPKCPRSAPPATLFDCHHATFEA
jgi:hypothetical protein